MGYDPTFRRECRDIRSTTHLFLPIIPPVNNVLGKVFLPIPEQSSVMLCEPKKCLESTEAVRAPLSLA